MQIDCEGKLIPSLLAGLLLLIAEISMAASCPPSDGVALQVLGSGGPVADDARASSGYLIWHDGRARVLVDLGGGALLRFAEAGARFEDLDVVLLTHLHADHSADLPALLKSGYFAGRERELVLAGPSGGGNDRVSFPPLNTYVEAMLKADGGAYGYLSGYLDGSGGMPLLRLAMLDSSLGGASGASSPAPARPNLAVSLNDSALRVSAVAVPHGPVPALAYRIEVGGKSLVFSGDQNGRRDDLSKLASGADLLVLNMPVPEGAGPAARALHAVPSRLGQMAAAADVKQLVLSHFMARSLARLDDNIARVRESYDGAVTVAEDLLCLAL